MKITIMSHSALFKNHTNSIILLFDCVWQLLDIQDELLFHRFHDFLVLFV